MHPGERKHLICQISGKVLAGMVSNPEWMKVAKAEAAEPDRGDIPHNFGKLAIRYAEELVDQLEEKFRER